MIPKYPKWSQMVFIGLKWSQMFQVISNELIEHDDKKPVLITKVFSCGTTINSEIQTLILNLEMLALGDITIALAGNI